MDLPKKRVCVVGGAGYIGSRLVRALLGRGYYVGVVDTGWFGNTVPEGVQFVEGDALYTDAAFYKGFDVVVFLAGLSNDPMAEFSPSFNFVSNVAVPAHIAYMSKLAGVPRFIYGDTCSVYGYEGEESTEETPTAPAHPYGASKLMGNRAAFSLQDETFSVIALRQGTVCGWSPRPRFDLLVNTMYKAALLDHKITVSNPMIWRPVFAISDAVEAYLKAIEAPLSVSGTFNVASQNLTLGEVAATVGAYMKEKHNIAVKIEHHAVKDFRNYRVSTSRAQEVLGIRFTGSVASILGELDEHYGPSFDYSPETYYNIKVFKKLMQSQPFPYVSEEK